MAGDNRDYGEWMQDLLQNPVSGGAKGCLFYVVALPVLIICGILGLSVFPPGRYPKIVLILPGMILAVIVLGIYGYIAYKLPSFLSVTLSVLIAAAAYFVAYAFGVAIIGKYF